MIMSVCRPGPSAFDVDKIMITNFPTTMLCEFLGTVCELAAKQPYHRTTVPGTCIVSEPWLVYIENNKKSDFAVSLQNLTPERYLPIAPNQPPLLQTLEDLYPCNVCSLVVHNCRQ